MKLRLYFKVHKVDVLEDAIEKVAKARAKVAGKDPDDEADLIWEGMKRAGLRADEFLYVNFDLKTGALAIVPHKLKKGKVKEE